MKSKKLVKLDKTGYFYFQGGKSFTRNEFTINDLDLLDACKNLVSLASELNDENILYLARVKYARSFFSLLAKISYYGFHGSKSDQKNIVRYLTNSLRKNYFFLMASPMPISRKILTTILCVNYKLIKFPLSLYRKIFDDIS
jgi:hypothetical protein